MAWVSVKQWYKLLMEKGVTHNSDDPDSPPILIPSKLEGRLPGIDWSQSYSLARKFGLSPDQKSFNFKLIQSLMHTRDRLARIGKIQVFWIQQLLTCPISSQVATLSLIKCL